MTIVPTKLYGGSRYIKLDIAFAEGKKKYDKRVSIKNHDLDRESRRRLY
jgi:tmRNA-binding protein